MKNYVYLVYDYYTGDKEVIAVCGTRDAARRTLLEYLETALSSRDLEHDWWIEEADAQGYDSVEEFKKAIRMYEDYDCDLQMEIVMEEIIF